MTLNIKAYETARSIEVYDLVEGAFREVAGSIDWLAMHIPFNEPLWDEVLAQLQQVELARQRYLEGEYDLALKALPEF